VAQVRQDHCPVDVAGNLLGATDRGDVLGADERRASTSATIGAPASEPCLSR
jgi:hypothetical protein